MSCDIQSPSRDAKTPSESAKKAFTAIGKIITATGASAFGVSPAMEVPEYISQAYRDWLTEGRQAGMAYMERNLEVRDDPRLLLEGAKSVISIAYSYRQPPCKEREGLPYVAAYALGSDYHDVLREKLRPVVEALSKNYGAVSRICIDSAPIHERYWAVRSGIGERCANGAVYVPGIGSEVFLAEIITTLELQETDGTRGGKERGCNGCGVCRMICPGKAIMEDGTIDSRRCINYMTIEHRGDFTEEHKGILRKTRGVTLFGCDRCLQVCPLNRNQEPTSIEELRMREVFRSLTAEKIMAMEQEEFSHRFKGSPLKRAKLVGLRRNLKA